MAIVTVISATVRMSRQTPTNEWVTIELGAEASAVEGATASWQDQQATLTKELKQQMASLFQIKEKALQAPAHENTERPAYEERQNKETGEIQVRCPVHKISRDSRHGGSYCPAKDQSGDHCTWSHPGSGSSSA